MSDQRKSRVILIAGLLLLLLGGSLTFFYWQKSENAEMENNRQAAELQGLELEKSMIERELDSLTINYQNVRIENENLRGKEAGSSEFIMQKDDAIRKIKAQQRRSLEDLRKQVEALRKIKIEYETIVVAVRSENEQLKESNRQLTGENVQLRDMNSELNGRVKSIGKQLEEQIRKTQSARFRATSFKVEVARKNDKLTVRAQKAHEIFISFDLADVPEAYRGVQKLYLAITDDKGRPILSDNPVKTAVQSPTGQVTIIAQQIKQVSLDETQRLSFLYHLDERLPSGNYIAAIYCETGLLGASSFRLV